MFRNRQIFRVLHATDEGGASGARQEPEGAQGGEGGADPDGSEPGGDAGKAEPADDGRTVNRYKHGREAGRLNGEIASLKAELEKAGGAQGGAGIFHPRAQGPACPDGGSPGFFPTCPLRAAWYRAVTGLGVCGVPDRRCP